MRTTTLLAVVLIVVGIIAIVYQGVTYTTKENVVDIGPLKVTADKTQTIPIPPIVGAVALVGGIVLVAVGRKKG